MADLFLMKRYWGSEDEDSEFPLDDGSRNDTASNDVLQLKLPTFDDTTSPSPDPDLKVQCSFDNTNDKNSVVEDTNILNDKSTDKPKRKKKKKTHEFDKSDVPSASNEHFSVIGQVLNPQSAKTKSVLPRWLSNPTFVESSLSSEQKIPVSELSYLDEISKQNLSNDQIEFLFPVQATVIPWLLQNYKRSLFVRPPDVCISAPTGSGKTLAYVVPIVQGLRNRLVTLVRALVVLPVVELATQVYTVFKTFAKGTDLQVVLLTGQKSFSVEQKALVKKGHRKFLSNADIVVTTPGRILDHIHRTEGFSLEQLRFLVIDEADRMMEDIQQGWLKQIESAVYTECKFPFCSYSCDCKRRVPLPTTVHQLGYVGPSLQKLLFSATLSQDPEFLHTLSLFRPKLFTTQAKSKEWIGMCTIPENLSQLYLVCKNETKPLSLFHLARQKRFQKILCFVDSLERAQRLRLILEEMGDVRVKEISSKFTSVQRNITLNQFKAGKLDLLVSSDIMARGMDIEDVDCVVAYDAPEFIKRYVHIIGRTARAGKPGTAITFVSEERVSPFVKMLKSAGMPSPQCETLNLQDLQVYVEQFKRALGAADQKLKTLKASENVRKGNRKDKFKKKRKQQSQETLP